MVAFQDSTRGTSDTEALNICSIPRSKINGSIVNGCDPIATSHIEIVEVRRYYPPGVSEIIGRGGECFIGAIDDLTVMKYPCIPGNLESIHTEAHLLGVLGTHPRIIASKGLTDHGLLLQRAANGSLSDYIASQSFIPLSQKLLWCKQVAEAASYIHTKHVIHCDINLRNFLLDKNFDLLLADFQGMLKSADGEILLDGLSRECSKSYMPRSHGDYACVFPELDSLTQDEEISSRFENAVFPTDSHLCCHITEKCWRQQYKSADEIVSDLYLIQASEAVPE
ncbi:conserved hypothetical protein [Histoplasma capsulatum H143]|uniref:Protein kinase domain-containing protein n=1 Tax=Ajellomyces capsulatus (strain H143) TaxID=544712 RepID=C6HMR9_AJECH|nr:conserved hypothetical protein [Histoplasma capsulatum H143]